MITSSSNQFRVDHNSSSAVFRVASVIFVNANVSGGTGNGDSWADAFDTLQDALAVATPYDEIWVAAGQYFPDEGSGQTNDDMESTFNIPDNVSLFGGFVGTETYAQNAIGKLILPCSVEILITMTPLISTG